MAENEDGPDPLTEGIQDDTPDEIKNFVLTSGVANKFTVMLKQRLDGGSPVVLQSFYNQYPDVNALGEQWGPGKYIYVFSWRAKGISGKTETMTKDYEIEMPERAWKWKHHDWLKKRDKERQAEAEADLLAEISKARIIGAGGNGPQVSEVDSLKKSADLLRSLGVPIGGPQTKAPEPPKKTFSEKLIEMAPAITALGAVVSPIAIALIQRVKPKDDQTLTNTLLAHVLNNKPQENEMMKQFPTFLMGAVKQLMDFKEAMQPEEKQSMVEKILDKLAPMVPAVLAMATQPKAALDQNPMVKMARADKGLQAIATDPEAAMIAVQKLDEAYGFQQANDILSVAGIERPEELRENYKAFPSKGFDANGHALDGRTPPPDGVTVNTDDDLDV